MKEISTATQPSRLDLAVLSWLPRLLYLQAVIAISLVIIDSSSWIANAATWVYSLVLPIPFVGIATALIYLIVGIGLSRRKRAAWVFTLASLVLLTAALAFDVIDIARELSRGSSPLHPADLYSSLGQLALMTIFILIGLRIRRHYFVRVRPGNFYRSLVVLLIGFGISFAVAYAIHTALYGFQRDYIGVLFRDFLGGMNLSQFDSWVWSLLSFLLAASIISSVAILMASQRREAHLTLPDELRIRELLTQYPADSLSYFATRRDKIAFFSGDCVITYRVVLSVCLASGDPIGPREQWPKAIADFIAMSRSFGWEPAVISAGKDAAAIYQSAGLKVMTLGDEAILYTDTFRRAEHPNVERSVRRLERLGYTLQIRRHGAIPSEEMAHLARLSDEWRGDDDERGFSMALGRLGDPADANCLMIEARFPAGHELEGQTAGLLSFVPWGGDGASLDVMRRHPEAAPGVTEFMVVGLVEQGHDLGLERMSLNFAVLREAFARGAELGASPMQRAYRNVLVFFSRWWQLESLYRSNDKYGPAWTPRYLCFGRASQLTKVLLASGIAEGFVDLPGCSHAPDQHWLTAAEAAPMLAIETAQPSKQPEVKRSELMRVRIDKRARLLDSGIEPYPVGSPVPDTCLDANGPATVAGRVMALRDHGGVAFADIRDHTGDLQLLLEQPVTFTATISIGDMVRASGTIGASRAGTRSLVVDDWQLIAKSLHSLPSAHSGLKDPETRVRQRYLDLIVNPGQRDQLRARSKAIQAVRECLLQRDYLEVETPILQPVHGGANARPFTTFINAYQMDLYLRIAPELYLKRLMVGGMDRVFEIGRNFRNEGADASHNPEFTMLEAYQAHADYNEMRLVAQSLVREAALAANGSTIVHGTVGGKIHEVDLAEEWEVISVTDAISRELGEAVGADTPLEELHTHADKLGMGYDPRWNWGTMVTELYEHLLEATTVSPTFYTDFPADTSPLTRQHRTEPRFAERWDLVGFGMELGTAYSELTDPVIQRERLTAQSLAAAGGDPEAMELDEAFLLALEHGMPPAGGLGMGLDRLIMWLTNTSIRETIAFPLVRPR
ncbi:lysyl-tRNA synthetase class 2 [Trueperella bonasi]|uniref:Lysine--tRNA ligase n=1 Tax=Trueperella bonasi TaxID=312286 RepID=A0ABT9NHN1_9ACTO|nr:bifunctional lysylphosphatidylglycerol synthetase/lysine--tRNA ligase LysX [Trueperella bonasi]MDP9806915.1 lysyl-tRNA synthetase class 2 [Trueperella bonasi]